MMHVRSLKPTRVHVMIELVCNMSLFKNTGLFFAMSLVGSDCQCFYTQRSGRCRDKSCTGSSLNLIPTSL